MSTTRKPGLPTAEEVAAHAERWPCTGYSQIARGLWRCVPSAQSLCATDYRTLLVADDGRIIGAPSWPEEWTLYPCTPDGRDVEAEAELTALRARVADLEAKESQIAAQAITAERRRIVAWLTEERDGTGCETAEATTVWDTIDSLVTDLEILIEATEEG